MGNLVKRKTGTKMFGNVLYRAVILLTLVNQCLCNNDSLPKIHEGVAITTETTVLLFDMFRECVSVPMPSQHFYVDDPKSFVNYPSRTTVGFAPKFTSNRKFFANMINTAAFKEMLAADEEELRKSMVKKMKYCDQVVMDQDILIDMYDREVDQSKI